MEKNNSCGCSSCVVVYPSHPCNFGQIRLSTCKQNNQYFPMEIFRRKKNYLYGIIVVCMHINAYSQKVTNMIDRQIYSSSPCWILAEPILGKPQEQPLMQGLSMVKIQAGDTPKNLYTPIFIMNRTFYTIKLTYLDFLFYANLMH